MKHLNIGEVLRSHTKYKSGLLKIYKHLQKQNQENIDLMRQIKPMLEKSEVTQINGTKELEDKIKELREEL